VVFRHVVRHSCRQGTRKRPPGEGRALVSVLMMIVEGYVASGG
jgi:hypothetical protein